MSQPKNVVIIGLGPAGASLVGALEASLPPSHRIVAISAQPYGWHTLGSLRASIVPAWTDTIPIPLDKVFKKPSNVVVAGKATSISKDAVTLDKPADGFADAKVPYDVLVIATGATYALPARPPPEADTVEQAKAGLKELQGQIAAASSVLVVGGGAVGCEYAGEVATIFPDKKVTLAHSHDQLHSPLFKKAFHHALLAQLKAKKVDVHLNTKVDLGGISKSGKIEKRSFALSDGQSVEADFVLIATGNKPNGGLAASLSPDLVDKAGFVKVRKTMQVDGAGLERVFALGDVASPIDGELKTYYNGKVQAGTVAKNILATLQGKALKDYSPPGVMGLVTAGSDGGVAQMFGFTFGAWLARMAKSKELLTPMVYAEYKATPPKPMPANTVSA